MQLLVTQRANKRCNDAHYTRTYSGHPQRRTQHTRTSSAYRFAPHSNDTSATNYLVRNLATTHCLACTPRASERTASAMKTPQRATRTLARARIAHAARRATRDVDDTQHARAATRASRHVARDIHARSPHARDRASCVTATARERAPHVRVTRLQRGEHNNAVHLRSTSRLCAMRAMLNMISAVVAAHAATMLITDFLITDLLMP